MAVDSAHLVASLHHSGAKLELKTIDLCFLAALYGRENDEGLTSIGDEDVVEVFAQVCELVEPDPDNVGRRATNAIQRLRDQKLLARIDGAGLVRAGDYNLTALATGIVEFFIDDERDVLTRESLALLTGEVIANLAKIEQSARGAASPQQWEESVALPLRITIRDLVTGIDRRQRGLERQQEALQARISDLLEMDWFASVRECEEMLEETASTLAELKTVLLERTHQMQGLLQDIEQRAQDGDQPEAAQAARDVASQLDRLGAWGSARQQAWSEYYQYVHDYLRDVVRLDPERALSERLRDQLATWVEDRFFLLAPQTEPTRVLREVDARVERPPLVRPRRDRETPLERVSSDSDGADLEALVRASLARSPDTLAAVLRETLPVIDEERRYLAIGEIAALVAEHTTAQPSEERPWVAVPGGFEIEDWRLRAEHAR